MRILIILTFLISLPIYANECFVYEIKGRFQITNSEMFLHIASGTKSEKIFKVQSKDAHLAAPYNKVTSKGIIVLKSESMSGQTIETVKSVSRDTPDPLHHLNHSFIRLLKKEKCP